MDFTCCKVPQSCKAVLPSTKCLGNFLGFSCPDAQRKRWAVTTFYAQYSLVNFHTAIKIMSQPISLS